MNTELFYFLGYLGSVFAAIMAGFIKGYEFGKKDQEEKTKLQKTLDLWLK